MYETRKKRYHPPRVRTAIMEQTELLGGSGMAKEAKVAISVSDEGTKPEEEYVIHWDEE